MSKTYDRARFVYRVGRVNYFRCLLCGAIHAASAIARHVARCKPQEPHNARLPYKDE